MSRTKKFMYNSVFSALLQVVTMIVGFILPRMMLDFYGSEINGLVSSITQFITYFNLVEAGLSGATVYALYKPLADNNIPGINGVLSAAKKFYLQSGYLFTLLTVFFAVIYPFYIQSDVISPINTGILVLILGVSASLEFFTLAKYRALLTADQKTYVISIATMVHIIINTTIIGTLAFSGFSIVVVRAVALFSVFIRSAILMIYCKRKYKYLDYTQKPDVKSLDKRWDALYLQILGAIHIGAPTVLITILLKDLKIVSVYAIFNMVMVGLNGLLGVFISGLAASFGELISKNQQNVLQKAYKEFEFIYYLLITIVYSVTFITIMPFVNIYTANVTDINYNMPLVGFLFVLNGLLFNIKTPQGMLVISAGLYKETKKQTTIQGLIVVVLGIVLTPIFGLVGVLIASVLSNLYRDIDLAIYIPKNVTKTKIASTFVRIARIFLCVAISFLPFFFIEYEPDNFVMWGIYAVAVGIYTLLVTALINFIFDKKEFSNVLIRIKYMFAKKNG